MGAVRSSGGLTQSLGDRRYILSLAKSVKRLHLDDSAVDSTKLAPGAVGATHLAALAVNGPNIAHGILEDTHFAANANINMSKLALAITNAQVAANANISAEKLDGASLDLRTRTNRLDQLAKPTSPVNFNNQRITNLPLPSAPTDPATKAYADAIKQGIFGKDAVRVATVTNISLAAPGPSIDGLTLLPGDRVLVKDQTNKVLNGIYIWNGASMPMTRSDDCDEEVEVKSGLYTFVQGGNTNADQGWMLSTDGQITVGTTELLLTQFSQAGVIEAGDGLYKYGNIIHAGAGFGIKVNADAIQIDPSYPGQTSITTLGVIIAGTWRGTPVEVLYGGTGATSVAGAKTNLGFMTRYATDVGNGSLLNISVTHNLGTRDLTVLVRRNASPYDQVTPGIEFTSTIAILVKFASAPTTNQYRVIVIG